MRDLEEHLTKLRNDAADYADLARATTDRSKRELFVRISQHLTTLAYKVEMVLSDGDQAKARRLLH